MKNMSHTLFLAGLTTKSLLLVGIVCLTCAHTYMVQAENPKHLSVTISLIIDYKEPDKTLVFLEKFNYSKWSIVLSTGLIDQGVLHNVTFVRKITRYGELLPGLWMAQTHDNSWKQQTVDRFIQEWQIYLGYKPYGFFMWQPDTYIANYLYSQGIKYLQGYCFDQYALDWMSMRGGWQQPYYASEQHVLVPASQGRGIVVLPHVIWDWRDSLELNHQYNSQPVDVWNMHNQNYVASRDYVLELMNATLEGTEPYAYFTSQNEIFGWDGRFNDENVLNHTDFFKSIVRNAEKLGATLEMFNETTAWFNRNYIRNPTYTIKMVSPHSKRVSEWFWNSHCRITRYDDEHIVGYVEYETQKSDPYLTNVASPNFTGPRDILAYQPDNCVDTSLTFTIDSYGNGEYRAPSQNNGRYFTRPLAFYPIYRYFIDFLQWRLSSWRCKRLSTDRDPR